MGLKWKHNDRQAARSPALPCPKPTFFPVGFSCRVTEVGPMERISEFEKIIRTVYQAAWIALGIIFVCTAIRFQCRAGWLMYVLICGYGAYLYFHFKTGKPTNLAYFSFEVLFILAMDWFGGSPLAVYLFPMLVLRRAAYVSKSNIYLEVLLICALYLGGRLTLGPRDYYMDWVSRLFDVLMLVLAAALAHPLVRITKSLQADREALQMKLHKVEASYQQAAELALRDGLTGLYNYRAFQAHVNGLDGTGFAILLIDVDHFKNFNDRYGHIVGDQVLVQLGQVILENVRRNDRVYRYGGEEFAVLLENMDSEMAVFTAERIRTRVEQQTFTCEGLALNGVTISLGVAVFRNAKISGSEILEQADKALYEAKARGRNNVVFFINPEISGYGH